MMICIYDMISDKKTKNSTVKYGKYFDICTNFFKTGSLMKPHFILSYVSASVDGCPIEVLLEAVGHCLGLWELRIWELGNWGSGIGSGC